MPNWCMNRINIFCENKEKLSKLEGLIKSWTSHNYCEKDFGLDWLGNIVGNSGIDNRESGDFTVSCRGRLASMVNYGNQLAIDTETAWKPMIKMWKLIVDKYLPEAKLTFTSDECGNDVYITNDESLKNCYIIDSYGNIEYLEYDPESSENNTRRVLQELLRSDESDIEKLIDILEESDYSDDLAVHKWELCSINDVE